MLPENRTGALGNPVARDRFISDANDLTEGWHHVALVQDYDSEASLYLDGNLIGSDASDHEGGSLSILSQDLLIGSQSTKPSDPNRLIDEVRIWRAALQEDEIRQYMVQKLDNNHPSINSLISAYKMDENDPNVLIDLQGGNDGTITGAVPVISGAPQGDGSLFFYTAGPGSFDGNPDDPVIISWDDASGGVHAYINNNNSNQPAASGFLPLTDDKYYGVFAPGQELLIQQGYTDETNEASRRIIFRDNNADNDSDGGWERLSGLNNTDVVNNNIFAFNAPGVMEFYTSVVDPPSTYPILGEFDPGTAMDFDGTDDFIETPIFIDALEYNQMTWEAWILPTDGTGDDAILSNDDGSFDWSLFINEDVFFFSNGANQITTGVSADIGVWQHIAAVFDGTTIDFYKNGEFQIQLPSALADNTSALPLTIGVNPGFPTGNYFEGQMDEIRIWKAAVSATEIAAFANTTNIQGHPNYTDMVAYYKFDDGAGTTLEDVFSNNDGTWDGAATGTNLAPNWVASGALSGAPQQNAMNFDGGDFIPFSRQSFTSGLTYEAWINTLSAANNTFYPGNPALTVIGDNDIGIEGAFGVHDGKIRYTHYQGTGTNFEVIDGTVDVNDGQWHHIAVTHKSGSNEVALYVDGVLDATGATTIYSSGISANRIGSSYLDGTGDDSFFNGDIDEVRIWNVALPEEEIRKFLYESDLNASPNIGNLVLHYNFDQGDAGADNSGELEVIDQSSTPFNGDLSAFTLNGLTSNFISSGVGAFSPNTPPVQSSNIIVNSIAEVSAEISWSNGEGQRRVVVVHEGIGNPFPAPVDGTFAVADEAYGLGADLDNGWFVVYNGYGNSTTVTNLSGGTDYEVAVLEVNGPPTFDAYNANASLDNPTSFSTISVGSDNLALEFDGTAQSVSIPFFGDVVENQTLTIEAWINPASTEAYILSSENNGGIGFFVSGGSLSVSDIGTSSNTSLSSSISVGTWQHVAITYDNGTLRYYVNGAFVEQFGYTLFSGSTNSDYSVGARVANSQFAAQIIDELRIWNVALSDTDIATRFITKLSGSEPNLVAYYNFEDGTGSSILSDRVGFNDGTLVGMDENTDWVPGPPLNESPGIAFFEEDFDSSLPAVETTGNVLLQSGTWEVVGVLEAGTTDARDSSPNAARIEPAAGNY
ncbi:MAG: LamG-like jellyroll fold domain-containing protein, partial [Bacteroidota bacterium]